MTTDQTQQIVEEVKQLSLDELKTISEQLLEEIQEREWDRVIQSPEGLADNEQEYQKTLDAIKDGKVKKYIPGKSIAELFQG